MPIFNKSDLRNREVRSMEYSSIKKAAHYFRHVTGTCFHPDSLVPRTFLGGILNNRR